MGLIKVGAAPEGKGIVYGFRGLEVVSDKRVPECVLWKFNAQGTVRRIFMVCYGNVIYLFLAQERLTHNDNVLDIILENWVEILWINVQV